MSPLKQVILGIVTYSVGMAGLWYIYSWEAALCLFLITYGNNQACAAALKYRGVLDAKTKREDASPI